MRFRCQYRKCPASAEIKNKIMNIIINHNHAPVPEKITRIKIMAEVKSQAIKTSKSHDSIVLETKEKFCKDNISELPKIKIIMDKIKKERNKIEKYLPKKFSDIPEQLKLDKDGDFFLRYDSGPLDKNRYIIFFYEFKKFMFFEDCETILIDGTFKIVPFGFYQMIVFHTIFLGRTYPIIYCLVMNKRESTYLKVFNKVKEITDIKPKLLITDFEKGLINSSKAVFSVADNKLCFFHFSQSIWRRIQ